ncbi:MAG: hypothetical protein KDJ34_19370 [Candidatus Competibacteraceae bacterium]|nr:hypothetical protein [Candidatus Competibacteraceae bacterium]
MQIDTQLIQDQIPYYLSQEAKENLVKALEEFPKNTRYYINLYNNDILQGDGWTSFELINFETGDRKKVKGIVLSNSCDIDPTNKRHTQIKITFAPIIRLERYTKLLKQSGLNDNSIEGKINAVKEQKVTTLFYLPKGNGLDDEYIAILDDLHTVPLDAFKTLTEREKLFTLSQIGFYLFILKLSVHFCRFHENIVRD